MLQSSSRDITRLLDAWSHGDARALEELAPLVESELRRIARRQMRGERPDHTLQATALVNEAFARLLGGEPAAWNDRAHFYAVCARVMRRVLIDHARGRARTKRGGRAVKVSLGAVDLAADGRAAEIVALDEALRSLEAADPRKCRIVELRYFGGLDVDEVADALGISEATVRREWRRAKAWLYRWIVDAEADGTGSLATN